MTTLRTGFGPIALALMAACAIPTEAPIYDTVWEIPGKTTNIAVNAILPPGVQVTSDGSAFQVSVEPSTVSISRTLSQDCAACLPVNGSMAPKPPFSGGGNASATIATPITSATLVHDTLSVSLANGLNFDPLRPSNTARGSLLIVVRNGSTVIGRDSIDGTTTPLSPGTTVVRKIPLSGTINAAGGIQVSMSLDSPAGDAVLMDVSRSIAMTASLGAFFVSSARVSVSSQPISAAPTELDLSSVDSTVSRRIGSGSLLFEIVNPFDVTGALAVNVVGAAMPIQKTLPIAGGTTSPSIEFTKTELAAMFGRKISLAYTGSVRGGTVDVAPGQVVSVASRFKVSIAAGGQ